MRNEDRAAKRSTRGFTLVELLIVIGVVAILAAIAIPKLSGVRADARLAEVKSVFRDLQSIAVIHFAKFGSTPTIEELGSSYNNGGRDGIEGKYAILDIAGLFEGDADKGHGNELCPPDPDNPGQGQGKGPIHKTHPLCASEARWVIYSTQDLGDVDYVYGEDDDPPVVAADGQDPLGLSGLDGNGNGNGNGNGRGRG